MISTCVICQLVGQAKLSWKTNGVLSVVEKVIAGTELHRACNVCGKSSIQNVGTAVWM